MSSGRRHIEDLLADVDQLVSANEQPLHSVVSLLETTQVPRVNIARWATQKYHQTYQQVRGFSAIHVATSSPDVREFQVAQIVAEETSYEDGASSHHEMMRRFALAAGATEADFEPSCASDAVLHFVEHRVELCLRGPAQPSRSEHGPTANPGHQPSRVAQPPMRS